jgi:hypothetical protein
VEILFLCLLLFIGILIVKAFVWIIKTGLFIIIFPIKIILVVTLVIFIFLIAPMAFLSVITSAAVSAMPVLLLIIGLILLIKHALS